MILPHLSPFLKILFAEHSPYNSAKHLPLFNVLFQTETILLKCSNKCSSTLRVVCKLIIGSNATAAQTPCHETLFRTDLGGYNRENCYGNDTVSTLASALSRGKYPSILE